MNSRPINILLAEDDADDRYLISEALDESHTPHRLYIAENGEELMDYLYHRGKFPDSNKFPAPQLILLDLNMPLKDGREALLEIKADPALRRIPILVLTTSQAEDDVRASYDSGVSGFITKPHSFSGLVEVMQAIDSYWIKLVELPPTE